MNNPARDAWMSAPISPALSLRQACRKVGYDDGGKRCPGCPLKELCESEERWIVRLTARDRRTLPA
jgi:hypothetical protein